MPLPEGYGEATFVFGVLGDAENMTFSLGFTGTDTTTVGLALVGVDLANTFEANVIPAAGEIIVGWTWINITLTMNPTGGPELEVVTPLNLVGSNAADSLPVNTALLIQKRTGLAGRANRGRVFLPPYGMDEAQVDAAGFIDTADLAPIQTKWSDFLSDFQLATAGNEIVILHSDPLDTPTPVTEFVVQRQVATQRRRLR